MSNRPNENMIASGELEIVLIAMTSSLELQPKYMAALAAASAQCFIEAIHHEV